jgi:hypothetical protein
MCYTTLSDILSFFIKLNVFNSVNNIFVHFVQLILFSKKTNMHTYVQCILITL